MEIAHVALVKRRFGERIRFLREMRGWSLEELAHRIGKSVATLSRIENGKQNLTMVDILRIAEALEVGPSLLFGPDDAPVNPGFQVAKRSAQRCARKAKETMQVLGNLFTELETFVAS